MLPLFGFKPQSLLRLAISAKMLAQSQKITKSTLEQVKREVQEYKKEQKTIIQKKVNENIADIMLGKDFKDVNIRNKKIEDIKQGKYDRLPITFYSQDVEIGQPARSNLILSTTIDEFKYDISQIHEQNQRKQIKFISPEKQAIRRIQQSGIVIIDQIDKLVSSQMSFSDRQISRQGVQRDLLPLLEGTTISTKIGDINTENILFIACGAFSMAKVEDLIPELLGRLPIRVQMSPISQEQLVRILSQPKFNLLMQQVNLLQQQGIKLQFQLDSITQMARFAYQLNMNQQNYGARRLQSITQKIVQDISFDAPLYKNKTFTIDSAFVKDKLKDWTIKSNLRLQLI